MTLFIFDPSLRNTRGHFYNLDSAVVAAGKAAGHRVRVLGSRYPTDPQGITPLDPEPFFFWPPGHPAFSAWTHERDAFRLHLMTLRPEEFSDKDVLFFHSLNFACLLGVADWLEGWVDRPCLNVTFFFSFDDYLDAETGRLNHVSNLYRDWFSRMARLPDKVVGLTEAAFMRRYLRQLSGDCVPIFHSPHVKPLDILLRLRAQAITQQQEARDAVRIGYLGHTKAIKGALLIGNVVEAVTGASVVPVRFCVQNSGVPETEEWRPFLRLRDHPAVEWIEGNMALEDYYRCLARCDLILLPYSKRYATHSSAILIEAIAAGIPTVVPSYSSLHEELEALGVPIVSFDTFEAGAIAKATLDAIQHLGDLNQACAAAAVRWNEENRIERLFEQICN